jgi:hypothetical protein
MRNGRKLRAAVACGAIVSVAIATGATGVTIKRRANVAAAFVVSKQRAGGAFPAFSKIASTADGIQALAAARRGPASIERALDFLRNHADDADTIGEIAEVVMALLAVGEDPRDFEERDLVAELVNAKQPAGNYSQSEFSKVYDQTLAILALEGAGETVPEDAWNWLLMAQCQDGGWQFDQPWHDTTENAHCFNNNDPETDFTSSDTNTTSLAVQALVLNPEADPPYKPFEFFRSARDRIKGGWVFDGTKKCNRPRGNDCFLTDTNSTSLVIQAYIAKGRDLPEGAMRALVDLQFRLCGRRAGAFAFTWVKNDAGKLTKDSPNLGATMSAIPALRRKTFPLEGVEVTKPVPTVGEC